MPEIIKQNNKISFSDLEYMIQNLPVSSLLKTKLLLSKMTLCLTEEEFSELRDLCGEKLQICGFDEAYNPTDEGLLLEKLIDKLFG
ncbi:MAG: hypothetical protein ACRCUQ_01295 [Alphaproteobacteria bacterium]